MAEQLILKGTLEGHVRYHPAALSSQLLFPSARRAGTELRLITNTAGGERARIVEADTADGNLMG